MTRQKSKPLRAIFQAIAAKHGLSEADLYVRDRLPKVVAARWQAWAECYASGYTYEAIAALAGWDATSVMHGVAMHKGGAK